MVPLPRCTVRQGFRLVINSAVAGVDTARYGPSRSGLTGKWSVALMISATVFSGASSTSRQVARTGGTIGDALTQAPARPSEP